MISTERGFIVIVALSAAVAALGCAGGKLGATCADARHTAFIECCEDAGGRYLPGSDPNSGECDGRGDGYLRACVEGKVGSSCMHD